MCFDMQYLLQKRSQPKLQHRKGFTIIEALVAVTILVTAITAVLTVVYRGVALATSSKAKIIAFYLAQEPIEYIRHIRDTNKLSGEANWLLGLDSCLSGDCTVDTRFSAPSTALSSCGGGTCPAILFDQGSGFYGYTAGWPETPYIRTTRIYNPPAGSTNTSEALIDVKVEWRGRSISVQEVIFEW